MRRFPTNADPVAERNAGQIKLLGFATKLGRKEIR